MNTSTDVLICGAGPAGLVLAIELARRGVTFELVEKRTQPFEGSRGKGIQPRTQEIFAALGVLDRLHAAGGYYPALRRWHPDGTSQIVPMIEETGPDTPGEPYHLPLMVPQATTEAILRERLLELGHTVRFGEELVGFEQDRDGVVARISGQRGVRHIRARYLVGCDGGRSFVRQALGVTFEGRSLGVRAIVADIRLAGLDRQAWHQFGEKANLLMLCPLMGTDLFQLQAPVPAEGDIDISPAGLQALVRTRSGRPDLCVHDVTWASVYRMSARLARHYRVGRVFLAGDAAHVHPPTGGQGLNTSIQDAWNLGWKLAAVLDGAPQALLDSYEAERRPIAADMLELSIRLLDNARRDDHRRGRETRQLHLAYRNGPLVPETKRTAGIQPGSRAPDARLMGAAGLPHRLLDLFTGTRWTLLGLDLPRPSLPALPGLRVHCIGPDAELRDAWGDFAAGYGLAAGEWVLVRPDGHVGLVGGMAEVAMLRGYLAQVLPCR